MKYTRKAYLRHTPPPSPDQSGQGRDGVDMTSLLKTMAVRQEEEKTPYTDQLVRFRDELQDIMMNPTMDPKSKLKLLNDKGSTYRDLLRRSRNQRQGLTNVGTPTPVTPSPVRGVPSVARSRPRVLPTPPSTPRARHLPLTPPTTVGTPPRVPWQTHRLLEAKKQLVEELKKPPSKRKRQERDSGVGMSPTVFSPRRTRSQAKHKGQGLVDWTLPYMTGQGWQSVRFTRH